MSPLHHLYRFLASLKLAVILLVMLMAILAAATYYESVYDAKTAQHLVYGSAWFAGFLLLLGVNVFCAAAVRYPWRPHLVGFVVTHAGILVILAGSLVTMVWGVDASMGLMEGETGSTALLDRPVLRVMRDGQVQDLEAEFRWNPPREGHEFRVPLGDGLTAVVDRYYHQAAEDVDYVAGDGPPAVKVRLQGRMADTTQWLRPDSRPLSLGPATLSFRLAASAKDAERFLAGQREPHRGTLQVLVGEEPVQLDVAEMGTGAKPLGPPGYTVEIRRYLPHAVVRDQKLVSLTDEPQNPTVEAVFRGPGGSEETWLLFAMLPDFNALTDRKGKPLPLRVLYSFAPEKASKASLEFLQAPDGRLLYRLANGKAGEVPRGQPVATGWMDFRFQVDEALPRSVERKQYRELHLANGQEGPGPAIRLRVEGSRDASPRWLRRGGSMVVEPPAGKPFHLGYGLASVDVGFKLSLVDFEIGYDPGTRTPASFKSTVRVEGSDETRVIQMNEPLKKNGYTFFQSSYQEVDGEPLMSIFSVARDPGIWIKYLGSVMLVLGIALHFYLRPYLIRRSHEAAMARLGHEEAP